MNNKWWWALFCLPLALLAQEATRRGGRGGALEQFPWVKYDADSKSIKLSDGSTPTQNFTPGAFLGRGRGGGALTERNEWRPPQDIEVTYTPTNETRVMFSHERHFGAMGVKDCKTCHAEEKGLGANADFKSFAADPASEPHGAKSDGRFCAECHRDNFKTSDIPAAKASVDVTLFSALGKKGDTSCAHCHAPSDHGADFTAGHGRLAENGAQRCAECHRGSTSIAPAELTLATQYREAQLVLVKNEEDTDAFHKTLPNNFCAYCHLTDQRPWPTRRGGGPGRGAPFGPGGPGQGPRGN